jgi:hypothetical protein
MFEQQRPPYKRKTPCRNIAVMRMDDDRMQTLTLPCRHMYDVMQTDSFMLAYDAMQTNAFMKAYADMQAKTVVQAKTVMQADAIMRTGAVLQTEKVMQTGGAVMQRQTQFGRDASR